MEAPKPKWAEIVLFGSVTAFAVFVMAYAIKTETQAGRSLPWTLLAVMFVAAAIGVGGIVRALKGKELIDPPDEGSTDL